MKTKPDLIKYLDEYIDRFRYMAEHAYDIYFEETPGADRDWADGFANACTRAYQAFQSVKWRLENDEE